MRRPYWKERAPQSIETQLPVSLSVVSEARVSKLHTRVVQFVGNRWKGNFPRRRSLAPVVSTSGRVSVAMKAAVKKHSGRKFSRQIANDSYDPVLALFAA
jgi:hypothetical protein